jgi:hypothetical protein
MWNEEVQVSEFRVQRLMGTRELGIIEVGKGGLPPLLRMARIKVAGASQPYL